MHNSNQYTESSGTHIILYFKATIDTPNLKSQREQEQLI